MYYCASSGSAVLAFTLKMLHLLPGYLGPAIAQIEPSKVSFAN